MAEALRFPRLGITSGLRGFFALKYDADGPIQTAPSSHATPAEAWQDARSWATAEGLPLDEPPALQPRVAPSSEPQPAKPKKKSAPLLAFDDSKGKQRCKSCREAIWWYELVSGKRHPFDAQADGSPPDYLMTEVDIPTYGRRLVAHIEAAVSHFATCPDSAKWKSKK